MNKHRAFVLSSSEKTELEQWVMATANKHEWKARLTRDTEYGSPTVMLVKAPRVIFAECLPDGVRRDRALTAPQRRWLDVLGGCGFETYVWRPRDRRIIQQILSTPFDIESALGGAIPISAGDIIATQNGINKAFDHIFGRSA